MNKRTNIPWQIFWAINGADFSKSYFFNYLEKYKDFPFSKPEIQKCIAMYYLGVAGESVTFPFIDKEANIHAIKTIEFSGEIEEGKKDWINFSMTKKYIASREPIPQWLCEYNKNDSLYDCLFGEHILFFFPTYPILLVQSPATAVFCSLFFGLPDKSNTRFICIAFDNFKNLTPEKLNTLTGRKIYVFTHVISIEDIKEWNQKITYLNESMPNTTFKLNPIGYKNKLITMRKKDLKDMLLNKAREEFLNLIQNNNF